MHAWSSRAEHGPGATPCWLTHLACHISFIEVQGDPKQDYSRISSTELQWTFKSVGSLQNRVCVCHTFEKPVSSLAQYSLDTLTTKHICRDCKETNSLPGNSPGALWVVNPDCLINHVHYLWVSHRQRNAPFTWVSSNDSLKSEAASEASRSVL